MSWANVNWDEVKAKYEEGTYTYQRLAEEYGVSIQTVCSHAVKGQWQRGREEAEKLPARSSILFIIASI